MCGTIAVLRRPSRRQPPASTDLVERLDAAVEAAGRLDTLAEAAAGAEAVDEALRGVPGVRALLADPGLAAALEAGCERRDTA